MKALMVLPTLLLQKNTLYIKIERQHRNFKREDLTSGKMGKQKNYLLKAKLSKKDYLKTTQRIKAQIGKQLYLLVYGRRKSKQSFKTFRKFK